MPTGHRLLLATVATGLALAACSNGTLVASPSSAAAGGSSGSKQRSAAPTAASQAPHESPVPPETNPPGDIPDNTQFVPYRSKGGGFTVSIPEGWARRTTSTSVSFTDKLNTIALSWEPASAAPTVSSATSKEVPQLRTTERAFQLAKVSSSKLRAGRAVLISFRENSPPSEVTGKQYRDEVLRYELFHGQTEIVLTLTSPVGADNVDPWRIVTQSLKLSA